MKVWITKYALTKGIIETEVYENCLGTDPTGNMISIREKGYVSYFHGKGNEWHTTKESAITKANEMRQKKISSLKKQIEKLEKMKLNRRFYNEEKTKCML